MNLQELESRLQTLIEVDLLSILPNKKVEDVIIQKLASAIQMGITTLDDGSIFAPNVYTLQLNPATMTNLQGPQLRSVLVQSITTVAHEAGFRFTITPTITIASDETIPINDARIVASHRIDNMSETNAPPMENEDFEENNIPENAFLIVEGVKLFPLALPVVNIGRRLDNQLVIDDPRVSRNHAQLRAIKGRYVVFDLNSTGGTFVNGQRTNQTVLYPGDVVSLAGVALIFGQDNPPPRSDLKDTSPFQKGGNDERPTAFLKEHSTAKLRKK